MYKKYLIFVIEKSCVEEELTDSRYFTLLKTSRVFKKLRSRLTALAEVAFEEEIRDPAGYAYRLARQLIHNHNGPPVVINEPPKHIFEAAAYTKPATEKLFASQITAGAAAATAAKRKPALSGVIFGFGSKRYEKRQFRSPAASAVFLSWEAV